MDPLKFAVGWLKSHLKRSTGPMTNAPAGIVRVSTGFESVSASTVNEIVSTVADPLLVAAGFHALRGKLTELLTAD